MHVPCAPCHVHMSAQEDPPPRRYVNDAIQGRRAETLQLRVTAEPALDWEALAAVAGVAGEGEEEGGAAGRKARMQALQAAARKLQAQAQEARMAKRDQYISQQVGGRACARSIRFRALRTRCLAPPACMPHATAPFLCCPWLQEERAPSERGKPFAFAAAALFLLPPLAALSLALGSGYLTAP